MKIVFTRILLLLFIFSPIIQVSAQEYVEMMNDPNVSFYTTQAAFNNYWQNRPIEKGKGYKAFRRWEAYMAPRVYPTGDITLPSQTYANYMEWLNANPDAMNQSSISGSWSLMGPIGKPAGGGAGRINFLRFDPTNSNTMYVGAPDGGLWKTTNAGVSWSTNTDLLSVIGCSDIAINPTNTQIMYLATGDGDAGDSYSIGVLKSTDGGLTWNTLPNISWTRNQARTISRLLINPNNPQIVMAFGNTGIWRTTDGGATWSQPTGTFNGIKDAEFKPGDPNTVYAAGAAFKRSTDGGLTWTTVTTGLTGIGRLAIAVTPANSAYVYVLASRGSDSGFLGLIRSTDSGASFTTRMASTASNNILGWDNGADAGGQGWYDLAIAASPTNAEEVYTGGVNIWKSTNGGTSFTLNAHWFGGYSRPYVHADIHDLIFLPGSGTTLFSGCDGGVFKTTNSGTNWSDLSANLAIAQQYRIGLSATNANLLVAGHQDNGTNKYNSSAWSQIYGGDGMEGFIDRTNDNVIYASYVYGEYVKSTNGGTSFAAITTGIPFGTGTQDWLCAWHQDPVTANTLYAGGRSAMYRTTNGGTNWSALGTPTGTGNITDFVICPSSNTTIYAIKSGTNAVSKSTNSGTNWTAVSSGLPTTVAPTCITVSNTDPNLVFVTYSGYGATTKVYKSTNGGTSWTNISTGLPNIPVNTIVYHNNSTNRGIYIGTDVGVYYMDDVTPWIAFNNGLPNVAVRDLEIFYPTGRLRAATYGRGTWDSDLYSSVPSVPVANYTVDKLVICEGQTVTFTNSSLNLPTSYSWTFAGGTPATSTATNPTVTYNTAGTYSVTLTATNSQGSDNEIRIGYITVLSAIGGALPVSEGFVNATFAPTGWTLINLDAGSTWTRSATVGFAPTAGNSMLFDNYNLDDRGNNDELRSPHLNFQGLTSAQLTFDVAHAPYDATLIDGLEVLVSTDCETSWTSLYSKSGPTLGTAAATTASFVPTTAQWRTETINLTPYINQANVTIAFRNLAGYGNNVYVDNINITGVSSGVAPTANFTVNTSTVCPGGSVTYTNSSTGSPTSYSWSFAGGTPATSTAASPTVSYNTAGVYAVTLTATNAVGSDPEVRVNYITVTTSPSSSAVVTNVACNGSTNGAINLTASLGTAPYSFNWGGGIITEDRTGLTAGTYTVTITDAIGCTAVNTTTVTQPAAALSSTAVATNVACNGGSTGAINLSVTGGTSAYSFNWGGGVTTEDRSGLAAGTYTVTISDANGCTSTRSATITQPSTALSSTAVSTNVACNGSSTGAINLTISGGTAAYSFNWGAGVTTEDRSGLAAGTYTVTISDANGCTSTRSTTITQPSVLSSSATSTNVSCNGNANGAINLTVSGGTAAYSFNWGGGITTEDRNGLAAGTYTVTVTDANACTSTRSTTITQPAVLSSSATSTNVSCNGTTTGAINLSVTGGTAAYSFNWGGGITTEDRSGLAAGAYTVSITDANGCTSTRSTNITQPSQLSSSTVLINNANCSVAGSIDINVSGGTAPYNYLWSNTAITQDISGLSAGNYSVTITDANGCNILNGPNSVTSVATPTAALTSVSNVSCNGLSNGSVNISVTGGTPGYTFIWNNGATTEDLNGLSAGTYSVTVTDNLGCVANVSGINLSTPNALSGSTTIGNVSCNGLTNGSINLSVSGGTAGYSYNWGGGITSEDRNGLSAGTYTVTISDANGCTATSTSILTQPTALSANSTVQNISCNGNSTGSINLSVSGGTTGYIFNWGGGITSEDRSGLNAGTYIVTVTDANGCTATSTSILTQPTALSANSTVQNLSCNGNSTGSINLTVSGGTSAYNFNWGSGIITEDRSGLSAGTYTVTITDANGCTTTNSSTLTQPTALTANSTVQNLSCNGNSSGAINLSVSGGTSAYSFNWGNGITSEDRSGLSAGTYTVTITDANACSTVNSAIISEPQALSVTNSVTNLTCNTSGAIDINVVGGVSPYSYLWSNGSITEDISGLSSGAYSLTLTDANGCNIFSGPIQVNSISNVSVSLNNATAVICNNASNGSIDVNVNGGSLPYSFSWSNGANTEDLNGVAAGFYTLTVTDALGCSSILSPFNISQSSPLVLSGNSTNVNCTGAADGNIFTIASGGSPNYTYQWSNGSSNQNLTGLPPGIYTVTLSDVNQCSSVSSFTISEPSSLTVSSFITNPSLGNDGIIDITISGGSPSYNYLWSNGETTEDISGLTAGNYTVTITDANGCTIVESSTLVISGIEDIQTQTDINILPNPSNGEFIIHIQHNVPTDFELRITDILGRKILDWNLNGQLSTNIPVDLRNQASGSYILIYSSKKGKLISRKLLITK